jgi:peptidoglycan/xylan/chitin deacetylase (PgdA/CDA1 family)
MAQAMVEPVAPPGPLLVRVDDIGRDLAADRAFLSTAVACGLRVTCGVVPTWVHAESSSVAYLFDLSRSAPDAVEIHQHGHAHVDHSAGGAFKFEHGETRDLDVQAEELRTGFAHLRGIFGELFAPVLSPPFGHVDDAVRSLAADVGFRALSALGDETGDAAMPAFSPRIDPLEWATPVRRRAWPDVVSERLSLAGEPLTGIVVHPGEYSPTDAAELAHRIRDLVGGSGTANLRTAFGWDS